MFIVIIQAGNDDREFIEKAGVFARRRFAEHDPKVIVRNADAYDPSQHERADAIITTSDRFELIESYEDSGTEVIAVDRDEANRVDDGPRTRTATVLPAAPEMPDASELPAPITEEPLSTESESPAKVQPEAPAPAEVEKPAEPEKAAKGKRAK